MDILEILRTPEDRFVALPGFPFGPHYVEVPGPPGAAALRMAYVDEGPRHGPPVLLLHGEPTWSFLYRNVIPVLAGAGFRVVAPDLIGFGRSDKPVRREEYTYQRQVDWTRGFADRLGLDGIRLLCHDWGGLIGLRLVAEQPDRFARVLATNTGLPTGDRAPVEAFQTWRRYVQDVPHLSAGEVVARYNIKPLPLHVAAAYDAPFPDESYKGGARQFPLLVPIAPDDPSTEANRRAWDSLSRFTRPLLTVFGDSDPFTAGVDRILQKKVPGAAGQPHAVLHAGHFIQEDEPQELATRAASFFAG
jgi:haloalkane dehalogenase